MKVRACDLASGAPVFGAIAQRSCGRPNPAQKLRAGDTVETKRAVQRFSAIKMRSLNDLRQGSLPTVQNYHTVEPAAATPASKRNRRIRHHPPANFDSYSTG
jgi:hypothetical protein